MKAIGSEKDEVTLQFKTRAALNAWLTASLKALAQGAPIDRLLLMQIIHDRLAADPLSIDRIHRDWYCRTLHRWRTRPSSLPKTSIGLPDTRVYTLLRSPL